MTLTDITPADARLLAGLEITTTRGAFTHALTTVGTAIDKRPAIPVLAGVHLDGDQDGTLTLTGYDYETVITYTLTDVVTNPGRCVLAHAELSGMLAATAKGTPKRKAEAATVTVAHNSGKPYLKVDGYTLPLTEKYLEGYPLPDMGVDPTLTLDTAGFVSEIARVVTAAGSPAGLPELANVQLRTGWYGLTMTATDRYRAARAIIPGEHIPGKGIQAGEALVDAALLRKLAKHLPEGVLTVGVHRDRVMLSSGPVTVLTSTSGYEFVTVDEALPKATPMSVTVDRKTLTSAIAKATNILNESGEGRGMSVGVTVSSGAVSVVPKLEGAVAPTFPAETTGVEEESTIYYNPKFLAEAVGAFATEDQVMLHLSGQSRPTVLTGAGHTVTSASYWHLMQPIRLT